MLSPPVHKPKFSFEISEEQQTRALKTFREYGQRKAIMSPLLDEVMDLIDTHGYIVMAVLLDKKVEKKTILPSLAKVERMNK